MRLEQLTERIFYYTHEQASDRPCLAYVRGDRYSLAVDAGYSERHLRLFYAALRGKGLPLPDFTVLTHWHFDHTLALHAAAGVTVSCEKTAEYLAAAQRRKNCCKICTKNSAAEFSAELRHFCRGALSYDIKFLISAASSAEQMLPLFLASLSEGASKCFPFFLPPSLREVPNEREAEGVALL